MAVDEKALLENLYGAKWRLQLAQGNMANQAALKKDLDAALWRVQNALALTEPKPETVNLDIKMADASGFKADKTGASFNWGFMAGLNSALEFPLKVEKAGQYKIALKYACKAATQAGVLINGMRVATLFLPASGSWFDTYIDATISIPFPQGDVKLKFVASSAEPFNVSGVSVAGPVSQVKPVVVPPVIDMSSVSPQAFVNGLKIGANIERGRSWYMGDFGSGTNSYGYLKGLGLTHVRLFFPWRPSVNMGGAAGQIATQPEFDRILKSAKNAQAAGLRVLLDCCDVMGTEECGELAETHVRNCGRWIKASGLDKTKIAIGAINEHGAGDNASWNPIRKKMLGILREELPGWLLSTGPAYWKAWTRLVDGTFELSDDPLVIYDVHSYDWDAKDPSHAIDQTNKILDWSKQNGREVVWGEAGLGWDNSNVSHAGEWAAILKTVLEKQMPLRPTLWAITDGNEWMLNKNGSDEHFRADLEQAIKAV